MPNITTYQAFTKANELYLPLAVTQMVTSSNLAAPNSQTALTNLIGEVERDILLNALGLTSYNLLQTALADLDNSAQIWQDLVNGKEYDGKVWEGLKGDYSLLSYAVYFFFLNQNTQFLTALGVSVPESENAKTVNPTYKLTVAWNKFITKYQGGYKDLPLYYNFGNVTVKDYFGERCPDDIQVSLYRYLDDNAEAYAFDKSKFLFYENQNSFGI